VSAVVAATARVVLRYEGVEHGFDYPHRFEDDSVSGVESGMHFQWVEGNYACDCNRIPFIEQYCGVDLTGEDTEVECGYSVDLVSLTAVYDDGAEHLVYPEGAHVETTQRLAALGLVRVG